MLLNITARVIEFSKQQSSPGMVERGKVTRRHREEFSIMCSPSPATPELEDPPLKPFLPELTEWFGCKGTLKMIQLQPQAWAGTAPPKPT